MAVFHTEAGTARIADDCPVEAKELQLSKIPFGQEGISETSFKNVERADFLFIEATEVPIFSDIFEKVFCEKYDPNAPGRTYTEEHFHHGSSDVSCWLEVCKGSFRLVHWNEEPEEPVKNGEIRFRFQESDMATVATMMMEMEWIKKCFSDVMQKTAQYIQQNIQ